MPQIIQSVLVRNSEFEMLMLQNEKRIEVVNEFGVVNEFLENILKFILKVLFKHKHKVLCGKL